MPIRRWLGLAGARSALSARVADGTAANRLLRDAMAARLRGQRRRRAVAPMTSSPCGVAGVEVDDGLDDPVAVVGRVGEDLAHPPDPVLGRRRRGRARGRGRARPGAARAPGVGVRADGAVLVPVRTERLVPRRVGHDARCDRPPAPPQPPASSSARPLMSSLLRELDAAPHRLAHHRAEGPLVGRDRARGWRRLAVRGDGVAHRLGVGQGRPLVDERGVGLADGLAEPLDERVELLAAVRASGTVWRRVR